jgi:iron complex outermembrane receptor protein
MAAEEPRGEMNMHRRVFGACRQSSVGAALAGLALLAPVPAMAASAVATFDQDASSLSLALQRLGQLTGAQLLYAPELTADQTAPGPARAHEHGPCAEPPAGAHRPGVSQDPLRGHRHLSRQGRRAPVERAVQPSSATSQEMEPVVGLEAVIVSSGKRLETLGRSDASVQALSNQMMDRAGVRDFDDLTRLAPTLTISKTTQPGNNSINVRGVGTYSYSIGTEPSVVVVIDDVPQAFQADGVHGPGRRPAGGDPARAAEHPVRQGRLGRRHLHHHRAGQRRLHRQGRDPGDR